VYISELFGRFPSSTRVVTTSHDISQIHYTAAALRSRDQGQRGLRAADRVRFSRGARADLLGSPTGAWYPEGASILKDKFFSSSDQLMTMFMGGEIYLLGKQY